VLTRRIAAVTVWVLLVASFLFSAKAAALAQRAYSTLAAKAYTADEASLREAVAETARAFVAEWATWTGDPKDYAARLGHFLADAGYVPLPQGVQEVASASVLSVRQDGPDRWLVSVLLRARRAVRVPEGEVSSAPPELRAVQSVASPAPGQQPTTSVWREVVMQVEVPIKVEGGRAVVAGLPVLVPVRVTAGRLNVPDLGSPPGEAFLSFVRQFLDFYYRGGDIRNFVTADSGVLPLGGWSLNEVRTVRVNSTETPSLAYVECTVSAPGAGAVVQRLLLDVSVSGGHFLVKAVRPAAE